MGSRLWIALGGIVALGAAAAVAVVLLTGPAAPGHEPRASAPSPPVEAAQAQPAVPPPVPPPPPPPVIQGPPVVPLPADREQAVERLIEVRQERFGSAMDALNRRTAARKGLRTTPAPSRAVSPTVPVRSSRRGALVSPQP
jgi:hypothetical protein